MILVSSSPDEPYADDVFVRLRSTRPHGAFDYPYSLAEVLRQTIADTPLTRSYKLVVLRRTPFRATCPRGLPAVPAGRRARRPARQFQIRCEPSDEHGTVFAVVEPRAHENSFRLVSLSLGKPRPRRVRA